MADKAEQGRRKIRPPCSLLFLIKCFQCLRQIICRSLSFRLIHLLPKGLICPVIRRHLQHKAFHMLQPEKLLRRKLKLSYNLLHLKGTDICSPFCGKLFADGLKPLSVTCALKGWVATSI